jgi:hypothetical protein
LPQTAHRSQLEKVTHEDLAQTDDPRNLGRDGNQLLRLSRVSLRARFMSAP